jgi:hypothetical protein
MGVDIVQYRVTIGCFIQSTKVCNLKFPVFPREFLFELDRDEFNARDFDMKLGYNSIRDKFIKLNKHKLRLILSITIWIHTLILLCGDIHLNPGPNTKSITNLKLCHCNIRSIATDLSKLDHIRSSFVPEFNLICLTETWLSDRNPTTNYILNGYQIPFRRDRMDNSGYGGIMVWAADHINIRRRSDLEINEIEALWLEVKVKNTSYLLCTTYRPPNIMNDFWEGLSMSISTALETGARNLIIVGDLNADPNSHQWQHLENLCKCFNLKVMINEPTRITKRTRTILDQFLTNIPQLFSVVNVDPPVSYNDHCTISAHINTVIKPVPPYRRIMWIYKDVNFDCFRDELSKKFDDFDPTKFSIDEATEIWSTKFMETAKKAIPCKNVLIRTNDQPWFNGNLRKLLRKKNRYHRHAKFYNTDAAWDNFKLMRNLYFYEIKQAKKLYFEHKMEKIISLGNKNSKKWWSLLKDVMGKEQVHSMPPIVVEDNIYTDIKDKANEFNKYFANVTYVEDDATSIPVLDQLSNANITKLEEIIISPQEVHDQLLSLNTSKSYGPDGIPPKLLREAGHSIVPSLCKLFNHSLNTKFFPNTWKNANVHPLFKKGNPSEIGNYRPVSLLNILSKVFEKIIYKHVYNHLYFNNHISDSQSGFLPGRSTISQLAEILHKIYEENDCGNEIRIVFLDISKAFDRVWHRGLLYKLGETGISGNLLLWFSDYLQNRKQRTLINGQTSNWHILKGGVPQGSVLGPLLFLVFINDIINSVKNCDINLFADDTCLIKHGKNRNEIANNLNSDLVNIHKWAQKWLVKFSPTKTESLIISKKQNLDNHPPLYLDGHVILEAKHHKHLGIILSQDLSWNEHISNIISSCAKLVNVLRYLSFKLDKKTLETIYTSFIRPKIEYANIIYGNATKSQLKRLTNLEFEILRLIAGATKNFSIRKVNAELPWINLEERRRIHTLSFFYKIHNNMLSSSLVETLNKYKRLNFYNIRSRNEYTIPIVHHNKYANSLLLKGMKLWNNLDMSTRDLQSLSDFKSKIKPKIKKEIKKEILYYGERWPNIMHARLRMGCSKLKSDLFYNLHVIDDPLCTCGQRETAEHFFLHCPKYMELREQLIYKIDCVEPVTIDTLLYGNKDLSRNDNLEIFRIVHLFIKKTKRFIQY